MRSAPISNDIAEESLTQHTDSSMSRNSSAGRASTGSDRGTTRHSPTPHAHRPFQNGRRCGMDDSACAWSIVRWHRQHLFLARLLLPADFGLIAMAMTLLGILEVLGSFSFDIALIQNNSPTAPLRHRMTLTVLYGAVNALALLLIGASAASFFSEPRLEASSTSSLSPSSSRASRISDRCLPQGVEFLSRAALSVSQETHCLRHYHRSCIPPTELLGPGDWNTRKPYRRRRPQLCLASVSPSSPLQARRLWRVSSWMLVATSSFLRQSEI